MSQPGKPVGLNVVEVREIFEYDSDYVFPVFMNMLYNRDFARYN